MRAFGRIPAWITGLIATAAMLCGAHVIAQTSAESAELARPADLDTWPSVGATVRMHVDGMAEKTAPGAPAQIRLVQMAPDAYAEFVRSGGYPDGAMLTATMYSLTTSTTTPQDVFGASQEVVMAVEVIDRRHPDSRRFYVFTPGQKSAPALPPGNDCARCHKANGHFDGTFSRFYPLIARRTADQR